MKKSHTPLSRRSWLQSAGGGLLAGLLAACESSRDGPAASGAQQAPPPAVPPPDEVFFKTRGAVITPEDLTLADWPERASKAGLTTLALHDQSWPGNIAEFLGTDAGKEFLEKCRRAGLAVEFELHAMRQLLPREYFVKDENLYRMDETGRRNPDGNLCVHSEPALEIVVSSARLLAGILRPSTGRYFFWGDDGLPGCKCERCGPLSESDQALIVENRIIQALRRDDPKAQLAHLAYARTYAAPTQVRPEPGVFLEFAPIRRNRKVGLSSADPAETREHLEALDGNLRVFGKENAQVLEYWLDASLYSGYKHPAVKIPWDETAFGGDLDAYGARGIRSITTFAVYVDMDYVAQHGAPPLAEYGRRLAAWRPGGTAR